MTEPSGPVQDRLPVDAARRLEGVFNHFEAAWREEARPLVENFLGQAEGPERAALLSELVLLDVYYRRRSGEQRRSPCFPWFFASGAGARRRGQGRNRCLGGMVVQCAEHGLLVCFGFPVAYEDAARRAAWTGLGILEDLKALGWRLRRQHKLAGTIARSPTPWPTQSRARSADTGRCPAPG
jgi:hypothetical protein